MAIIHFCFISFLFCYKVIKKVTVHRLRAPPPPPELLPVPTLRDDDPELLPEERKLPKLLLLREGEAFSRLNVDREVPSELLRTGAAEEPPCNRWYAPELRYDPERVLLGRL